MRHAARAQHGNRLNGRIVVLWRAGLRIKEAVSLIESDLDQRRGSILVRQGLCRIRRNRCYARVGFYAEYLRFDRRVSRRLARPNSA
jgi:site-specific recombinase XerD